ncbi:hypothetical protein HN958_03225, partial [Candidatus Falkowbacteria bacterium]|nr:hypothetical protein [Candidatus Falkowbacteria bacterium]
NIMIISESNDHKKKKISPKQNLDVLCNIYNNKIESPELLGIDKGLNFEQFKSLFIRMYYEQMSGYQFDQVAIISRNLIFYLDILPQLTATEKLGDLQNIFIEENKITLKEYFILAFCVQAIAMKDTTFKAEQLTMAQIENLKEVLQKTDDFLNILVADYSSFRKADMEINKLFNGKYTKNRFNPLFVYPIVETQISEDGRKYVIPNFLAYIDKAFRGVFWWFNNHFEKKGKALDFRIFFGGIFEEYVKLILNTIYGKNSVKKLILKNGEEFFDWYVIKDEKVYLFEAKAYQFNLVSKTTAEKESVIDVEIGKVAKAMKQVNKNVQKISKNKELSIFRGKKVIPIIVALEMPFVDTDLYDEWLLTKEIKKEEIIRTMNIEELEVYENGKNKLELEDILDEIKKNHHKNFTSIMKEKGITSFNNTILDKKYKDFANSLATKPLF